MHALFPKNGQKAELHKHSLRWLRVLQSSEWTTRPLFLFNIPDNVRSSDQCVLEGIEPATLTSLQHL